MTENNQAAASEDDQDVGHVGVGAYVALIITILFFSGLFYNIDGYKWLGSFDFTTLAGGFGKIDGLTYIGKGGFGARQGFLFALSLFPSVMLALGVMEVVTYYGAMRAAQKLMTPLLNPILGVPGSTGLALITDLQSTDAGAALTKGMYDGRVPSRCRRMEDGGFCCEPQVCLLEGDEERAYYLSGWLPDQSIVVMDEEGRYYHVEKGHGKRYVACNRPSDRSEDFDEAVALLRRQADERVEKRLREEKCEYERKRQRIISRSVEAVPFQIGVKWGLRTAERILIPPVYRRILHPVGGYCAYQDSSCQWGVLAVDGRIIIRARYMEVEIDRDGTARLTLVPGKMETVKLTD